MNEFFGFESDNKSLYLHEENYETADVLLYARLESNNTQFTY